MPTNQYRFFTKEEDQIILDHANTLYTDAATLLPNRSKASVLGRAKKLGIFIIKETEWTDEDEIILKNYFPKIGMRVKEMLPGKSSPSIRDRANMLKLRLPCAWSKEEDYQIRKHGMEVSFELMQKLPGRTRSAVQMRINHLSSIKAPEKESYSYIQYPLNVYITIFDTHKGYDRVYQEFDYLLERHLQAIVDMNPTKPILANNICNAFRMRYKDHFPTYDISRELSISEEDVDRLCSKCITILKRTMIKR